MQSAMRPVLISNRCLRRHRDWLAFGDGADDRLECADHFQHIGRGNRKRLSGFNRLGEGFQQYAQRIRRWVNFCFRAPPNQRKGERSLVSRLRRALATKYVDPPKYWRCSHGREQAGPLSNCTRAAVASRGSGGGFCEWTRASTSTIGPTRFTNASSTCKPAPVMPPPGDSVGSSRQPPFTRVECSLLKFPSI